jgi:hypothetical protein
MHTSSPLVNWYYNGPIGWWFFALLALGASFWLLMDSNQRHLPLRRWRSSVFLPIFLLLPTIFFLLIKGRTQPAAGLIFLAGVLGGLASPGIAIAYFIRYRNLVGCVRGHPPYQRSKGVCPICARQTIPGMPGSQASTSFEEQNPDRESGEPEHKKVIRFKVNAWLATGKGYAFQLFNGQTTIGRDPRSDIRFFDSSVSHNHAKITEEDEQFMLYDLGSTTGTFLNGARVRHPEPLKPGDLISLGEGVKLTFTTDAKHPDIQSTIT